MRLGDGFQYYLLHFRLFLFFVQMVDLGPFIYCRNTFQKIQWTIWTHFNELEFANIRISNLEHVGTGVYQTVLNPGIWKWFRLDFCLFLVCWEFEEPRKLSLNCWNVEMLKLWNVETSKNWNFEVLEPKHFSNFDGSVFFVFW